MLIPTLLNYLSANFVPCFHLRWHFLINFISLSSQLIQAFLVEAFLSSLFSHILPSLRYITVQIPIPVGSVQNNKLWVVSSLVQALKCKSTSYVWVSLFTCLFLSASVIWPWVASNSVWMRMTLNPCCYGCFSRFWSPLPCLVRESEDIVLRKHFQSNFPEHFCPHIQLAPQIYFSVSAKLCLFLSIK